MEGLSASILLIAILEPGHDVRDVSRPQAQQAEDVEDDPEQDAEMVRPSLAEVRRSSASPGGHAVAVAAIAGAVYLAQAGQVLAAAGVGVALAVVVFLKSTPAG